MSTRPPAALPSAPTEPTLRAAALRHLARYTATRARLLRVLDRRIDRWLYAARAAAPDDDAPAAASALAKQAARRVVAALAATGAVDDAAYANGRAGVLLRSGRSRAKVAQHLATRGIDQATLRDALPENPERERAAALMLCRRRQLGPYAPPDAPPEARQRALGILARAGFAHATAAAALAAERRDAEEQIEELRRS